MTEPFTIPHEEYRELVACRIFYGEVFAFCTSTGMDGPQIGIKGKERVMKCLAGLAAIKAAAVRLVEFDGAYIAIDETGLDNPHQDEADRRWNAFVHSITGGKVIEHPTLELEEDKQLALEDG